MAVKDKEAEGKVAGKGEVVKGLEPEKVPSQTVPSLQEIVEKTFDENIAGIIRCILFNVVELKHLGNAKFLIEFMTLMRSGKDIPAATYQAFAERLRMDFLEPALEGSERELDGKQSQGENTPVTDA